MHTLPDTAHAQNIGGFSRLYNERQGRKIFGHSREADWAIGGAAVGFTVALVEFISNNIFDKSEQFSSRSGTMMEARKKDKRKFKEFDNNDLDLSNSFGQDDNEITFRNLLQEHYTSDIDDIYDYEDYSYTEHTFPPDKLKLKYDRKKLNSNHVSSTRSPWIKRKLFTTTPVSSTRSPWIKRKLSTTTPVSSTRLP